MDRSNVRAETWRVRILGYRNHNFDIIGRAPAFKLCFGLERKNRQKPGINACKKKGHRDKISAELASLRGVLTLSMYSILDPE